MIRQEEAERESVPRSEMVEETPLTTTEDKEVSEDVDESNPEDQNTDDTPTALEEVNQHYRRERARKR